MDLLSAINRLVGEDYLDEWSSCVKDLPRDQRAEAFRSAEPLWIKRMVSEGKLLIHPVVAADLKNREWKPIDLHRRMIWASVLASIDSPQGKERFNANKARIVKKHGNDWWFDIYKRVKPAYAARMRIKKNQESHGPVLNHMARHSSVFALALHEEREAALKMIPKN
ncbi:hypothetical protein R6242_20425 [Iodobacter sp. CM08]|uniref:hypothetical protein n=1 Tax=Iodobacter sp. CM08 TaxID=3085902 RepID=UPI0029820A0F|nr:hypothetical protein [Iodobacter sp. CM08]MDW5418942.1 hypothetical protein [Iodobacter sp. CM08]